MIADDEDWHASPVNGHKKRQKASKQVDKAGKSFEACSHEQWASEHGYNLPSSEGEAQLHKGLQHCGPQNTRRQKRKTQSEAPIPTPSMPKEKLPKVDGAGRAQPLTLQPIDLLPNVNAQSKSRATQHDPVDHKSDAEICKGPDMRQHKQKQPKEVPEPVFTRDTGLSMPVIGSRATSSIIPPTSSSRRLSAPNDVCSKPRSRSYKRSQDQHLVGSCEVSETLEDCDQAVSERLAVANATRKISKGKWPQFVSGSNPSSISSTIIEEDPEQLDSQDIPGNCEITSDVEITENISQLSNWSDESHSKSTKGTSQFEGSEYCSSVYNGLEIGDSQAATTSQAKPMRKGAFSAIYNDRPLFGACHLFPFNSLCQRPCLLAGDVSAHSANTYNMPSKKGKKTGVTIGHLQKALQVKQ